MSLRREGSSPFADIGFRPKQTIFFIMDLNISSIVRSLVIGAAVVPFSFGAMGLMSATTKTLENAAWATTPNGVDLTVDKLKSKLATDCIKFLVSKDDSSLERQAKTAVDKVFGGDVNHREVCDWVIS